MPPNENLINDIEVRRRSNMGVAIKIFPSDPGKFLNVTKFLFQYSGGLVRLTKIVIG